MPCESEMSTLLCLLEYVFVDVYILFVQSIFFVFRFFSLLLEVLGSMLSLASVKSTRVLPFW